VCGGLTQITGAPIDRDPTADNLADAQDVNKVNDFDYSDDPAQVKCPFTSHLRKVSVAHI
jgi:deferrochelatase/peroxidase EfeB